jgi:hypothetical protein
MTLTWTSLLVNVIMMPFTKLSSIQCSISPILPILLASVSADNCKQSYQRVLAPSF